MSSQIRWPRSVFRQFLTFAAGMSLLGPIAAAALTITDVRINNSSVDAFADDLLNAFEQRAIFEILEQSPTRVRLRSAFILANDIHAGVHSQSELVLQEILSVSLQIQSEVRYTYRVSATLQGALTTVNDGPTAVGNDVAEAHIGPIEIFHLASAQPASFIDVETVRGPTNSTGTTPVSLSGSKTFDLGAQPPTTSVFFRLAFTATCRSEIVGAVGNGPECAARFGLPATFADQTAGLYPGLGNRDQDSDGLFITIELLPERATLTPTATRTETGTPTPTATASPPLGAGEGFRINDISIVEGNFGSRNAVFTVNLDGLRLNDASVTLQTADGIARAGSDYTSTTATLSFSRFESEKTFAVPVLGDRAREGNETFFVNVRSAEGAVVGDGQGVGVILNDDETVVGIAELVPFDSLTAPGEITTLTLRWLHPERWRDLDSVDLRLIDEDGVAFWARFEEATNVLRLCSAEGVCGEGHTPGTASVIDDGGGAALHVAQSSVVGSGPTGPSVDLNVALALTDNFAGRIFRVEAAARDDSGEVQDFETVGSLEVASENGGGSNGCTLNTAAGTESRVWISLLVGFVLAARRHGRPGTKRLR